MLEYFTHIRARLPFPTVQEHCTSRSIPTAQGWEKLQAKLEEEGQMSPVRSAEIASAPGDIFRETISVGTRGWRLFELAEDDVTVVAGYLAGLQAEESPFAETYPRPLSAEELGRSSIGRRASLSFSDADLA